MLPKSLTFVDVETTGMRSGYDRIIEVGVLRVEEGKVVKTFNSLVNPGMGYIPEQIVSLTGILATQLENAPYFREIKDELKEILDGAVMVAHNVRFDYSFLKHEFKRVRMPFAPKHFCTVKLARNLFPNLKNHNLDSIIENFKIECKRRHRAFDDAQVLHEFIKIAQTKVSAESLEKALKVVLKKPSLPLRLDPKVLEDLPEDTGVYIFYGSNGVPLYVGKSVNIKERVMSHFASDILSSKEMKISQQVESIETQVTCGELGALLLESSLVKKMQPLYNRKLRVLHKLIVLKSAVSKEGYFQVILDQVDTVPIAQADQILGIFRSKNQAKQALVKIVKEHSLCEKLLGLESGSGECFGYRLGRCKGACKNREKILKYNLRFLEAFSGTKLRPWPFKGPIVIEKMFLIDKWCYLGNLNSLKAEYLFDLDTYKIVERYIRSSKNQKNIKEVKQSLPDYY